MRFKLLLFISILTINVSFSQVGNSPYPIIFVHGLNSGEYTWDVAIARLRQVWDVQDNHNLNFVLNARSYETSKYSDNVIIPLLDINGNTVNSIKKSNIYTINFNNYWNENINDPRIFIHNNLMQGNFSRSNESAIYKQGFALSICIDSVLRVTGAEKVILVGHSMGGLAIREYLQRKKENGTHKWWNDTNDVINGHKVAKVLTMSTPHLGSNTLGAYLTDVDEHSEAMRDLKFSYVIIPEPLLFSITAPYLFSNLESEIPNIPLNSFYNKDVNCNNSIIDFVDGISYNTSYSSVLPLPTNITYTWLISKWYLAPTGDGCVDANRQWLYDQDEIPQPLNISDTLKTNLFHTSVPEDITSLIRGLDEPDTKEFAYKISLDKLYSGFITSQPTGIELDLDFYKFTTTSTGNIVINFNTLYTGVTSFALLSADGTLLVSKVVTDSSESISYNGTPGDYYLKIIGNSYYNPYLINYVFKVSGPQSDGLIAYYPFNGNANDESGYGYNGTVSSASLTTDIIGNSNNAYYFDGVNDFISIPDFNLTTDSAVTVRVLVRPEDLSSNKLIFHHGINGLIQLFIDFNRVGFSLKLTNDVWYGTDFIISEIKWYDIVGVWKKGEYIKLYVDGVLRNTIVVPDLYLINPGYIFNASIGVYSRNQLPDKQFHKGKVDELRVYNRALTLSEIQTLYTWTPNITLNSPNGGEIYIPGTTQNITWNSHDVQDIKIDLSTDNGIIWSPIISSYASTSGSYTWTIPDCNSSSCKIRISDVLNSASNDVSGSTFIISPSSLSTGLIAYYPFNGNANDESGNEYNGTVSNATLTTDYFGNVNNAYYFDGDNDFISIPDFNLTTDSEVTVRILARPDDLNSTKKLFFHGINGLFQLFIDFNRVGFSVKLTNDAWYGTDFIISEIKWYDIVGVWKKGEYIKLYVDGVLRNTIDILNLYLINPGYIFNASIGVYSRNQLSDKEFHKGKADELRVYNRALTLSEIQLLYNNSVLPVELLLFKSTINSNNVKLQWATSSETNNAGFDIERKSFIKEVWDKIGFVAGNGNSNEHKDFSFTDKNLSVGKYKYRLKQIDYNGNYKYYNLAEDVIIEAPNKFNVSQNYPNPFNPSTIIKYDVAKQSHVKILVYDILGREVKTLVNELLKPGRYEALFDGSNLTTGVYLYKITAGDFSDTKRMLLIK